MTTLTYYSRSCEKEADMIAATTLHCAQGGIDYFRQALIDEQMNTIATEETAISFWTLYFRFFSFLGSTLNWKTHPSLQTRIDYLIPLAEQQLK
jgi:Zn-dependent protease with chaperone function